MNIPRELRHKITHEEFQKRLSNPKGQPCRLIGYVENMKNAYEVLSHGTYLKTGNVLFTSLASYSDDILPQDPQLFIGRQVRKYIANATSILPAIYTGIVLSYQKPYYQVQYAEIDVIEDYSPKELLKFLIPEDIAMHILESVDRSPPLPGVVYVDVDQFQMQ